MVISVKSVPATVAIMLKPALALIGGVVAVLLTGGVLSIASLIGFITLFRITVRNGLLLVDDCDRRHGAGQPLGEVDPSREDLEHLNAILMTALSSALGALPLALAFGAGNGSPAAPRHCGARRPDHLHGADAAGAARAVRALWPLAVASCRSSVALPRCVPSMNPACIASRIVCVSPRCCFLWPSGDPCCWASRWGASSRAQPPCRGWRESASTTRSGSPCLQ